MGLRAREWQRKYHVPLYDLACAVFMLRGSELWLRGISQ